LFAVVLYEPEIAPNTGNILRLASNAGARLHLVRPLGFSLRDRQLARAGLDYGAPGDMTVHADWSACREHVFLFGPETRGLPQTVLETFPPEQRIRIPMREGNRSMNLANAVAVVVYEAWRQQGFATQ
jgi:tRNA (cytidine/uridine-2'-O-)-methyltransferase